MLSRKAIVDRTIQFRNPPRIPIWVDGAHLEYSDILTYDLSLCDEDDPNVSEWGFARIMTPEGGWAIPKEAVLADWKEVDVYKAPPHNYPRRLGRIAKLAGVCQDRYRLASFGMSGYSVYCALRGEELSLVDCLIEPDRFLELMECIFEFETDMFDILVRKGFHGIEFCDDWGERKTSKMTLSLWRCLLKNHYARQFKRARDSGLHVWFSTSSECSGFFGDLREIGANVVRVETPYSMEVATLGRKYRGKVAFATRLDELVGNSESIDPVRHVYECLSTNNGGFIGTIADNVPEENIRKAIEVMGRIR